jgi:tetratricopeptide (TPR) repeat protein
VNPRLHERSLTRDAGAKGRLEALHRVSPWAYSVTKAMLKAQYGEKPPAQAMIGAYSAIADYNANACADIAVASTADPKAYVDWMTKAAVLNPTYYYNLAIFLEKAKRSPEAAAAYEMAIGADRNEVRVSDTCRWLVMYYEDNGRPQDATKLADRAAEAYSAAGLLTKAALLEKRRQLGDALSIEDDLYDRYKEPRYLLLFICRAQAASPTPELALKLRQDAERFVTGGLEPAHLESFSGPPGDGMLISSVNQRVIDGGLSFGDVVVALHGYRVRNFRSYVTIRNMWGEVPLDMVVWRGGHYLDCAPNPAHGRFGVDFDDYLPK